MHELSLLEDVREILQEQARSQRFSRVSQITLAIGKLSCVAPDALRFGFGVVMKGSLAEQAELIITEVDGLGVCRRCHRQCALQSLCAVCPHCGGGVEVVQGTDVKIKELVVS